MKKVLFLALCLFAFSPSILPAASVDYSMTAEEEISNETLDELFAIAADEWGVSKESLWDDYNNGKLTVTEVGPDTYELVHETHGGLEIILESGI